MKTYILLVLLVLGLALTATGLAIANGGAASSREALSGGASYSAVGNVTLQATLGQPAVGSIASGETAIGQGYWHSHTPVTRKYNIYLPLITTE